mgnify:CR=1 FL=1
MLLPEVHPFISDGRGEFERRYQRWADLHHRFGSARSYPYAWRLPDVARHADASARARAALALAETLYAMGRFGDALAALPPASHAAAAVHELRARCLWLTGALSAAREAIRRAGYPDPLDTLRALADFAQLSGDGEADGPILAYRQASAASGGVHEAWSALLLDWLDPGGDMADAHLALAWLRRFQPAFSAVGEAIHAEARFRASPAHALVWLDHALEQVERYGQHGLKSRLLQRKAMALEAAGQLGLAARCAKLAHETAQRQGTWLEPEGMAP